MGKQFEVQNLNIPILTHESAFECIGEFSLIDSDTITDIAKICENIEINPQLLNNKLKVLAKTKLLNQESRCLPSWLEIL